MGKVATEATLLERASEETQKECLYYLRRIADGETTPTTWTELTELSASGKAKSVISVGDTIEETYDGVTDKNVWVVIGYKDVELEDGTSYTDVPIIQMLYTNTVSVQFDAAERDEATEETALAGTGTTLWYVGVTAGKESSNDTSDYTILSLAAGDTIPYSDYGKIYHSDFNSKYPAARGVNSWEYSFTRQYLNHKGTGWAKKTHTYDVLPSSADTMEGFMSYMPDDMLNALHPIKIHTKQTTYLKTNPNFVKTNDTDITYDLFWLLSVPEMNMYASNASLEDGDAFPYYANLIGSNASRADGRQPTGTYANLIKYALNAKTSAQYCWLRSTSLGGSIEWIVYTSGYVNYSSPCISTRLAPACALI